MERAAYVLREAFDYTAAVRSPRLTGADRAPPPRLTAVWDVLQCHRCLYTWRTTEPARRRADAYPEAFRLTPEAMANAPEVPAVPPLRDRA